MIKKLMPMKKNKKFKFKNHLKILGRPPLLYGPVVKEARAQQSEQKQMPTGLGNRKVLTPRTDRAPRRSLPPHTKLIEAESMESLGTPSSPDIMTTKLQEKVKMKKKVETFNDRLASVAEKVSSSSGGAGNKINNTGSSLNNRNTLNNGSSYTGGSKLNEKPIETERVIERPTERSNDRNYERPVERNARPVDHSASFNNSYSNYNNSYNSNANSSYNQYSGNNFDRWSAPLNHPSIHYESSNSDGLLSEQLNNVKRDYEALKARYAELCKLRNTEAEDALSEHRRLSEARDAAADRTIKSLQNENERLKRELAQARQEASASTSSKSAEAETDTILLAEKEEKILEFQKRLKIEEEVDGEESVWNCSFSSRSGRFQFTLRHDSASNRYQYLPAASSSLKALPEFLTADILIGADQMQIFFWRMLDTLTKQKQ